MRFIGMFLALSLLSSLLRAQPHAVSIYCTVDAARGKVNYFSLKKLLPDSVYSKTCIQPHKELGIRDNYGVMLYLTQNGWKMAGIQTDFRFMTDYYSLCKEIYLDDDAYALFMQKLKGK